MRAMYVAVALLMLVVIACGSPEPVEPTPTPDVPAFAQGEAEAVLYAYLRTRPSCGYGRKYPVSSDNVSNPLVFHWSYEFATTTSAYLGYGEWVISTDIPDYRYERNLVRKGILGASWRVYETSLTVARDTAPVEC
jgi:hypothetical protein